MPIRVQDQFALQDSGVRRRLGNPSRRSVVSPSPARWRNSTDPNTPNLTHHEGFRPSPEAFLQTLHLAWRFRSGAFRFSEQPLSERERRQSRKMLRIVISLKRFGVPVVLGAAAGAAVFLLGSLHQEQQKRKHASNLNPEEIRMEVGATTTETQDLLANWGKGLNPPNHDDAIIALEILRSGRLDAHGVSASLAASVIYSALDEFPDEAADYLTTVLRSGGLDVLEQTMPLPLPNSPQFCPLLGAYAKRFGASWEKSGRHPRELARLNDLTPIQRAAAVQELAESNDSCLKLSASLHSTTIAQAPNLLKRSLELVSDPNVRLKLLREGVSNGAQPSENVIPYCSNAAERVVGALYSGSESLLPMPNDLSADDIGRVVKTVGASEENYSVASATLGPLALDVKVEIIKELSRQNLVAATRALSKDPEPPDKAIVCVIEKMTGDPDAAILWANRIRDTTLRNEVLQSLSFK